MPRYYFPPDRESSYPLIPSFVRRVSGEHIPPPARKDYQVQIPGCTELAGCTVKNKSVRLSKGEAQYWLDQGVIGETGGVEHQAGAALGIKTKK